MRIDTVELHVGEPDFPYQTIRQLEAKSEARTAFSASPTQDAVNAQLRTLAAQVGADAVIRIEYKQGISRSSWNSLKGTGLAVRRLREGEPAPVPAPRPAPHHHTPEPLRSTDNNRTGMYVLFGILLLLMFIGALSS